MSDNIIDIEIHALCLIDSPCYNVSYYHYDSIRPYYIVIHLSAK